jgi:hypothetical protein
MQEWPRRLVKLLLLLLVVMMTCGLWGHVRLAGATAAGIVFVRSSKTHSLHIPSVDRDSLNVWMWVTRLLAVHVKIQSMDLVEQSAGIKQFPSWPLLLTFR